MVLKNYLYSLLYILVGILIGSLIINLFYYFDIVNSNLAKWLKFIVVIISSLTSGIYIGKRSINKGYLSGIKLSLMVIGIFTLLSIILREFGLKTLLYNLIIGIIITFGSMIGINKKRT